MKTTDDWKFKDPQNTAIVTSVKILQESKAILQVSHDVEDGTWQFHTGEAFEMKDAMMISLREITLLDQSVCELADLPLGWNATRKSKTDPWIRYDQSDTIMK